MNRSITLIGQFYGVFVLVAILYSGTPAGGIEVVPEPLDTYRQLKTLHPTGNLTAIVNNLTLKRGRGTFTLRSGTLSFLKPVAGVVTGSVFLGDGSFRLTPPFKSEKDQIRRFTKKDSIDETFTALYIRFSDETFNALKQEMDFQEQALARDAVKLHDRINRLFLDERHVNLPAAFTSSLLNKTARSFFFAVMECRSELSSLPYFTIFSKDDNVAESMAVYQFSPHKYDKSFYTLCSYDPDATTRSDSSTVMANVYPSHYVMDIQVDGAKLSVDCEVTLTSHLKQLFSSFFLLQSELEVDSVRMATGDTLQFIQEKDEAGVTVFFPDPLPPGLHKIHIYYHGKALLPTGEHHVLKNNIYWYPRRGYFIPATYDITYHYGKNKNLLSVGEQIEQETQRHQRTARWVENTPVPAFAFGIADYDSTSLYFGDKPRIHVHSVGNRSKSLRQRIGGDVASSFYFLQSILGEYPYNQIHVVETPSTTSNGFAGLLFLAAFSYEHELHGINEALRGHEVSHQWWGNIVGWQTYHDQWLSEGLAEYSGALVTQFLLKDDEIFLDVIEGWRNDLLKGGHVGVSIGLQRFGFSSSDLSRSDGLKAGPIWLGNRTGQKHPIDYHLIVYEKGAYVIHMLRLMLRDFQTGSDARFFRFLRQFVAAYQNKKAATADFAMLAEQHAGRDLSRFFQQWVYGTEVPTVLYDYQINENKTEEYWVEFSIQQEDVSDPFELQIPVGFSFSDDDEEIQILEMDQWQTSAVFGPFKTEPKKINFNTFGGVLVRVKHK